MRIRDGVIPIRVALVAMAIHGAALGDVHLEWRPIEKTVVVGATAEIGCYAISDDPKAPQRFSAVDLIMAWDPDVLKLLGVDNTGAVDLFSSNFPEDPFGLNETIPPQDGDGLYQALANLGQSVEATPEGTLLTTLQFLAVATTSATEVAMLAQGGSPTTQTVVWDALIPNHPITGTLDVTTISIVRLGDFDASGTIDRFDFAEFHRCLTGPGDTSGAGCQVGDFDPDGDVDLRDWAGFQNAFADAG